MIRWVILFIIALLLSGCSSSGGESGYGLDELKSAPERVKLGGKEYYIEAYIWRNLMPVIDPKDVAGLSVNIKVKTTSGEVPDSIRVSSLWVINKDSVWESQPDRVSNIESGSIEYSSRSGPFWEAGIKVDVAVQVRFKNQKKLLQVKEQKINAVY